MPNQLRPADRFLVENSAQPIYVGGGTNLRLRIKGILEVARQTSAVVRTARSTNHRQGDAINEDGDDREGSAEQNEDAEGEERAQDTILEWHRGAESAELGGDPNGDVDSDQRSHDLEGWRVVDPGGAEQDCGGEDARLPGEEDVFGGSLLHEFGVLPGS